MSAYLDGELQPGRTRSCRRAPRRCADCIAAFHQLKEVRAAMRTLPRLEIPERLLPDSHLASNSQPISTGPCPPWNTGICLHTSRHVRNAGTTSMSWTLRGRQ